MESPIDLRNLQDYYADPSVCLKEDSVAFQDIDTTKYRRGICAIITNGTEILLLERTRSSRWQFVQGGIENEDTSLVTLHKEIWEEIGLESKDYTPIAKLPTALSYALPPEALKDPCYASRNYMGQAHIYYLVE
jgi:8-oxo-dGTP pyrophosphatase MutT (NUDIX family)